MCATDRLYFLTSIENLGHTIYTYTLLIARAHAKNLDDKLGSSSAVVSRSQNMKNNVVARVYSRSAHEWTNGKNPLSLSLSLLSARSREKKTMLVFLKIAVATTAPYLSWMCNFVFARATSFSSFQGGLSVYACVCVCAENRRETPFILRISLRQGMSLKNVSRVIYVWI